MGKNLTNKPIKIEFLNLSTINPQYENFDALGWKKKKNLYIYINEKHKDAVYIICMCLIGLTENFLMVSGYNFALLLIAEMINGSNKQKIENKSNSNQEGYMLNYEKR